MLILCDQHLGASRKAGTTPLSSLALKTAQQENFRESLRDGDDVVLVGDLFDKSSIDNETLLSAYTTINQWLFTNQDHKMWLVRGNHDINNNASKLSSLDVLAKLLGFSSSNFRYITEPFEIPDTKYLIIPHLRNQDLLDLEIERYRDQDFTLLAHLNYDLHFAENSDHSLNLSKDQAKGFKRVIIGHEHVSRKLHNVYAVGTQFPTSIADVRDGDDKWSVILDGDDVAIETTWGTEENYLEVDWNELDNISDTWQFIRVMGNAGTEEAGAVIGAIVKLRKRLPRAFVISNAVEIEGVTTSDEELEALSSLETLNIVEMLLSRISDKQATKVREVCGL